ncbi:Protein spaetzle 3 [Eumeta japonica]|uniref:Protein spaetzle 3 n=1 Tax=Eumeta variegata TaxID=151549 RepID=A0A4C1TPG8_EUMVA|nr:Protein spaetzle 3 [Eumeta japonica]
MKLPRGPTLGVSQPAVTPLQGPILLRNGTVPVVPLTSYPTVNNGSFYQIPAEIYGNQSLNRRFIDRKRETLANATTSENLTVLFSCPFLRHTIPQSSYFRLRSLKIIEPSLATVTVRIVTSETGGLTSSPKQGASGF